MVRIKTTLSWNTRNLTFFCRVILARGTTKKENEAKAMRSQRMEQIQPFVTKDASSSRRVTAEYADNKMINSASLEVCLVSCLFTDLSFSLPRCYLRTVRKTTCKLLCARPLRIAARGIVCQRNSAIQR
jgi:hypothetical protein